jgi:hypothetical protein
MFEKHLNPAHDTVLNYRTLLIELQRLHGLEQPPEP